MDETDLQERVSQMGRPGKHNGHLVEKACEFIREKFNYSISVDCVASACNVSSSHLAHQFKQMVGTGPMKYRDELRIIMACHLLTSSKMRIADIAEKVGYENQLYFCRVFKQKVGRNPSSFRVAKEHDNDCVERHDSGLLTNV
jgi:AraC family transcriptional regulator of arabinose operon